MKNNNKNIIDKYGPEYVVEVRDAKVGMEGFLVVHNTALGPGKGGIRMTPNITVEEVKRLASTMTWKNALAGIPFGGAKAGIRWDASKGADKKEIVQSFARAIKPFLIKKYIGGPDVNSGEKEMQWFVEAVNNWRAATGKPANYCMKVFGHKGEKCGIPHEFGSTGYGVAEATAVAAQFVNLLAKGASVAIHGFGNVGTFVYTYLTEMGFRIVALADAKGAVYSPNGFDDRVIKKVISEKISLIEAFTQNKIPTQEFWSLPIDILIPASVTDVINDSNKDGIKAKVIVEAGNIPMSESIEEELFSRGILIVPDFVANAGGVISSYAEYRGYNAKKMFDLVKRKIVKSTEEVLRQSIQTKKNPRVVAMQIAINKVEQKMNHLGKYHGTNRKRSSGAKH
ncbi:MAG: Glu/Leu/Phe/Val dehydrogenase [bacterium]|nr:Glu/Leu/Phe/Val dehydrogenase [bacterium]